MPSWALPPLPAWYTAGTHPSFVGRRHEMAQLEAIWDLVENGLRQAVFVGGEPGSGKTRLGIAMAEALHAQGVAVLVGTNFPELSRPYQPLVEALNQLLLSTESGSLAHLSPSSELLRITPHLRRHWPDLADPSSGEQEYRLELFDAYSQLVTELARDRPLALFLEDLHWSTAPTRLLLSHLIHSVADAPLLVFATMRTQAPDRSDELSMVIADLYRLPGVSRIDLAGLESSDIETYLRQEGTGEREHLKETAVVLRDQTGGNPFFLREMWRQMSQSGGFRALRAGNFAPPPTVRDALERRLRLLSEEEKETLELAAIVGDTFDVRDIAEASGLSGEAVLAAFDTSLEYGLLRAHEQTTFDFQHALIRQTLLAGLPAARSANRHARLAEIIERRFPTEPQLAPLLAHLFGTARALGYDEKAVHYLGQAAMEAERGLAHEEAADLWERGGRIINADRSRREAVLLSAAQAYLRAGDFANARRMYKEVHSSDDSRVSLLAAIGFENASWRPGNHGQEALDLLTASLRTTQVDPRDPIYVNAITALGRAHTFAGRLADGARIAAQALEMARATNDDGLIAEALVASLLQVRTLPGKSAVNLQRATELREIALRTGDYDRLGPAGAFLAFASYMGGNVAGWYAGWEDIQTAVAKTAQPFWEWVVGCHEYCHHFMQGEFGEAEATAERNRALGYGFGSDDTDGPYGVQMFMTKRETGQLEGVRALLRAEGDASSFWRPGLLALYTEFEMEGHARKLLWELLNNLRAIEKGAGIWPAVVVFLAEAAIFLRDMDALAIVRPLMSEYEGYNLVAGQSVIVFGSSDRYLAEMFAVAGDFSEAETHFEKALAADIETRSIVHQGETLAKYSSMLTARNGPGDRERAADLRHRAYDLASPIGHRRVLRRLAPLHDVDRPNGLTPREIDVLRLLAAGASNKEIGDQLFISQNTAANHVRNILIKTDSANRTQAAIYATDNGLLG